MSSPFLPDWMFAAFAIGGWELFDWLAQRLHQQAFHWIGGGIVALCALILGLRYVVRFVRKMRHNEEPDPEEWKHY
ncbi:hypothetical protein LLE49_01880 [Alicyclobacillus tolerans]|uniref:hypothetical protein n=1 Tax=Alicyclobacillus tolerans TaxID=90970 RepID=UPI001F24C360|nr:hypothetical protein [Alicyclobacillus tolerans]MCF8563492.1 hypothetical protein [Alicyclobacillus tolerans]